MADLAGPRTAHGVATSGSCLAPDFGFACCDSNAWTGFGSASELGQVSVHNIEVVSFSRTGISRICSVFCGPFLLRTALGRREKMPLQNTWLEQVGAASALLYQAHCYTQDDSRERQAAVANLVPGNVAQCQAHRTKEWFPTTPMEYIISGPTPRSKTQQLPDQPRQQSIGRSGDIFYTSLKQSSGKRGTSSPGFWNIKLEIRNQCIFQPPAHQKHQEFKQLRAGMGEGREERRGIHSIF